MNGTELSSVTMITPAGPLTILAGEDGAVRASGFTAKAGELLPLVHRELRSEPRPRSDLGAVSRAVTAYFDGELTAVDAVPVRQRTDGAFMALAWEEMRTIKPGEPITYTEFAELAGKPRAIRAAGTACARNAAALFVPCHRVLRTDGSLGGYRWGLAVKKWLLGHERRLTEMD